MTIERDTTDIYTRSYFRRQAQKAQAFAQKKMYTKTADFSKTFDSWRESRKRLGELRDGMAENNRFIPDYGKISLAITGLLFSLVVGLLGGYATNPLLGIMMGLLPLMAVFTYLLAKAEK